MKKLALLILVLTFVLALTSCGGEKSPSNTKTATAAPTAAPTAEPTAEPISEHEGPWVIASYSTNSYMHTDYVYDENGNITRETWRNTTRNSSGSSLYTYIQNADGTTSVRRMAEGEAISGDEFIFDANGWCTESIYYSALTSDPERMFTEDHKESRTSYEYDESGRLIRTTHESLKNDWSDFIKEYSYDENNRLISRVEKDFSSGEIRSSFTISYSEDGMSAQTTSSSGSTDSYTREDFTRLGVPTYTYYTHDERGGRWTSYSYEYDENDLLTSVSYKNTNNIVPVEYFIGMGHLMEEFVIHDNLTFKPLSIILKEQSAN